MSQRGKLSRLPFFFEFTNFPMPARVPFLVDFLQNERLRRLVQMIDFSSYRECIGLDIGCGCGYLTQYLAHRLNGILIGIDISRDYLLSAKIRTRDEKPTLGKIEFIHCDITHLPFRKDSIDLVVCASVLEHVNDLEGAVKEIKDSVRKRGSLIAGYPIETSLFKALLKLFAPYGLVIRDPRILGKEEFERSPETHKQSFTTIRSLLQKYFLKVQTKKFFFTMLPDQISWYECVKMNKEN
jgi:ubiquinone/menaquinone biosynthesis C-methylase UbiE